MSWTPVAVVLPVRALDIDEAAAVMDVLDAAEAWAAGELPLTQALAVGTALSPSGHASPAWSRYLAVRTVDRDDPRRDVLLRLIDAALRLRGLVVTEFGVFTPAALQESDACVLRSGVRAIA